MTIVIAYVPTAEGDAALRRGIEEALARFQDVVVNASRGDALAGDSAIADAGRLAEVRKALEEAELAYDVRQPMRGDPAEEIVRVAEDVRASLIVIGLRRRTPVGKLVLGSTGQRVLLDASCPVLAVKAGAG